MRYFMLLPFLFSVSSCAEFGAFKSSIGLYSQQAADDALDVKAWSLCKVTSRGALKRKFDSPEKEKRLNEFCEVFFGADIKPPD